MSGPGVSLVLARQVEMRDLVSRDHRVLGELALYFARVYNGVIDFRWRIDSRLNAVRRRTGQHHSYLRCELARYCGACERSFAKLDGKIVAVPYETANGRTWVTHFADPEFMEAWLSHPDFHMIK
jgi:uncharacterized protein DUF6368